MWAANGDDANEKGETVRLYVPILYGRKPSPKEDSSLIGGHDEFAPSCVCKEPTNLLAQVVVPGGERSRVVQVYACNKASCVNELFRESKLNYGGGGVVVCRTRLAAETQPPATTVKSEDPKSENKVIDDDDWGEVNSNDDDDNDLEAKLAAMESLEIGKKKQAAQPKKEKQPGFPCYELHAQQEPPGRRFEGMDDDDVGFAGSYSTSDDKIQQMLAKYMQEEEDPEILAALRCATGGGGGGKAKERDQRLSAKDRALLSFSDRLKRCPRQVVRYAYDGVPMWSIPTIPLHKEHKQKNAMHTKEQPIPKCDCGCARVFEMQLLPSLLHVLNVDKYADTSARGLDAFSQGGMNWGNIAVYTCPKACGALEYVVVQESVDEAPAAKPMALENSEPVVIAEGTQFDDDEDDDDEDLRVGEDEGDFEEDFDEDDEMED